MNLIPVTGIGSVVGPGDTGGGRPDPRAPLSDFFLRFLAALSAPEEPVGPGEGWEPMGAPEPARPADPEHPAAGALGALVPAGEATSPVRAAASPRPPLERLEGVHPELVARVERVADRMWNEFGHRVEVVEGHRTQARQEQLYAQGRTTPGPQVTWTRNSAHTRGEAVDVRIDGGWDNTRAFERLQQVAREEGIRTLGMKDAGHLELPRGAAGGVAPGAGWHPVSTPEGAAPEMNGAPLLRPGVAQVAQVAQVARVARPGHVQEKARVTGAGEPRTVASAARVAAFRELAGRTPDGTGGEAGETEDEGVRLTGASVPFIEFASAGGETGRSSMSELASQILGAAARNGAGIPQVMGAGGAAGLVPGAGTLLRAEQIRALQAAAGPASNLSLELTNVDGAGTDLHLGMRGRDVTARIDAVDPLQARAMRLRLGELRSTLAERGLEAERLGVRLLQAEPLQPVREGERGSEAGSRSGGEGWHEERGRGREQDDGSGRGGTHPGDGGFGELYEGRPHDQ
ncbi:MAG: hypothetical protein EA350_09305 [Gemmatimonadales bacterium]|nr:MAG: hypothetical protein EA350_09305 [Gemmatimonadales bacterium]